MSYAGAIMGLAGGIQSALAQEQQGQVDAMVGGAQQSEANYEADALRRQAQQVRAQGSMRANISYLDTKTRLSGVQAAASARGGTATSPTALALKGQTAARGEYNSLSELYGADVTAQGMETQANLKGYEGSLAQWAGKVKQRGADLGATTTALNSVATFASKYGGSSGGMGGWDTTGGSSGSGSPFGGAFGYGPTNMTYSQLTS